MYKRIRKYKKKDRWMYFSKRFFEGNRSLKKLKVNLKKKEDIIKYL